MSAPELDEFRSMLVDTIAEIFNPEVPFRRRHFEGDDKACEYCDFRKLCNR